MKNIFFVMVTTIFLICCGQINKKDSDYTALSSAKGDQIKILEAFPKTSEKLKVGSNVAFKYKVQYNLVSSDTGTITLVVQGASNETLANALYVVEKGDGIKTLEAKIAVPDTRAVQVFTPLSPQNSLSTTIVDYRQYKVEK
jgi:hypothetical protein